MAALLESNMRETGSAQAEIDDTLSEVKSFLARAQKAEMDYYDAIFDGHRAFGDCLNQMAEIERSRTIESIRLEGEHLGAVRDALQDMQAAKGDLAALAAIAARSAKKFGFTQGNDELFADAYNYTQMDFLQRNAVRLESMRPATFTKFPADRTRIANWNGVQRLQLFAPDGKMRAREEFIVNGLQSLSGREGSFAFWFRTSAALSPRREKIATLISLYKAGIELGVPESRRIHPDEIIDEVFHMRGDIALRSDEVQLMRQLNLQTRIPLSELQAGVLFNETNREQMGLAESTFKEAVDNAKLRSEAEMFAKSMITMGRFLFAPGFEVERIARAQYRPMALNPDVEETRFDDAIRSRESRPVSDADRKFIYALDGDGHEIVFESPKTPEGGMALIPATARRDYRAVSEHFHTEASAEYFSPPQARRSRMRRRQAADGRVRNGGAMTPVIRLDPRPRRRTLPAILAASMATAPCASAFAVDLEDQTTARVKATGSRRSWEVPVFSDPSVELAYNAQSNLNESARPPKVSTDLEASISASIFKQATGYVQADLIYSSVGNEIVADNDGPAIADLSAGAYRMLEIDARNSVLVSASFMLPTSDASRREGYLGVGQAMARSMTQVYRGWLRMDNVAAANYVSNRFEASPTALEVNSDLSGSYLLAVSARLFHGFRIGASGGMTMTRYLDGSASAEFANSQSISYLTGGWTFRLALTHGDWTDRRAIDFLYLDRYRELITTRIAYAF